MPLEHQPTKPVPPGPRPGSRLPPYRVGDDETLDSVAKKFRITVNQLAFHNFGTTNEREINWYLGNPKYVGCKLTTRDQKNWRFSRAAAPGFIYIPLIPPPHVVPVPVPTPVPKPVPIDLNDPKVPEFVPVNEVFKFEFKIPPLKPADLGYVLAQVKISVEVGLKQLGAAVKISLGKEQVKIALEKEFSDSLKGTFAVKFDDKSLEKIAKAVESGSKGEFGKALFAPFEASMKHSYHWRNLRFDSGFELSSTPVVNSLIGQVEKDILIGGVPYKGTFAVKIELCLGLSNKAWAWLADKVGRPALRWFLTQGGRAFATATSEGVLTGAAIIGGAVIATAAMTSLCAWALGDANRKAKLDRYSAFYVEAYTKFVFGDPRPGSSGILPEDYKTRIELQVLGEKDAVLDARATLAKVSHPAARGTDQQAIEAFRDLLKAEFKGGSGEQERQAKSKLWRVLDEKAKQAARR